jgi:Endoribonuclease L-PSP
VLREYRPRVGGDYADVVKTTTFTTDVEEYHRVNDERAKYFKSDLPTSALIGVVRLAHPDLMVELEVMAVIPTERLNLKGSSRRARPASKRLKAGRLAEPKEPTWMMTSK